VRKHLVSVIGHAGGTAIAGDCSPHVGSPGGSDDAWTVRDLDDQNLAAVDVDRFNDHRHRWLRGVCHQRLDPKGVGATSFVPRPRTANRAVIFDTYKEDAAATVREAYDSLDQIAIIELAMVFTLELGSHSALRQRPSV